jgi:hypothetical protein
MPERYNIKVIKTHHAGKLWYLPIAVYFITFKVQTDDIVNAHGRILAVFVVKVPVASLHQVS